MRTTAEAEHAPAAAARGTGATRRGRAAPQPQAQLQPGRQAVAPPRPPEPAVPSIAVGATRMLHIDPGLYALHVGEIAGNAGEVAGMAVPVAHVSAPFAEDGDGIEIVAAFPGRGPWLGPEGGTVILRSPPDGGHIIVTVYGAMGQRTGEPALDLRRLDRPGEAAAPAAPAAAPATGERAPGLTASRDIPTEILLHIERAGDRLFPGRGWVGALGRKMRIEGFSIRPLEQLAPAELEMKGFLPNGGETPWVPGGALCGTRGRGLPLIGFAVRVAPQRADRFEVLYQGSFFAGGISETHRDGDPCRATGADDPLEAISVRIVERVGDAAEAETGG